MFGRSAIVLALILPGCGRIGFTASSDGAIGGADGDAVVDPDASPDAPLGQFGTPTLIASLSDAADDDDPTLTADLLEIYFTSQRAGGPGSGDLWSSKRASASDAWGAPAPVLTLDSAGEEDTAGIAGNGLTIWFSSNRGTGVDIYQSTRPDRASPWMTPTLVTELSTVDEDTCSEPSRSELRMMTCQGVAGARKLYEATRAGVTVPWSTPVALASLNTVADQKSGFLATDLTIWFSTMLGGSEDIYVATRPTVGAPFGAPTPVIEINDPDVDDDPWLSPDGRLVVFSSHRSGNFEIWQATR